jgi:hypothetical protein
VFSASLCNLGSRADRNCLVGAVVNDVSKSPHGKVIGLLSAGQLLRSALNHIGAPDLSDALMDTTQSVAIDCTSLGKSSLDQFSMNDFRLQEALDQSLDRLQNIQTSIMRYLLAKQWEVIKFYGTKHLLFLINCLSITSLFYSIIRV